MARTGPITTDTSTLELGLSQIRVGNSATNIGNIQPVLTASDSIGSLTSTKFIGNTDWYKHESGFPLQEDYTIPMREAAMLECAFEEITPYNVALAHGIDASAGSYPEAHSGEVGLGSRVAPEYVRMESVFTYPNGTNHMYIIFPRAQVSASVEIDNQAEDAAAVAITFEAKQAGSDVSGGDAVWDSKSLGRIFWD